MNPRHLWTAMLVSTNSNGSCLMLGIMEFIITSFNFFLTFCRLSNFQRAEQWMGACVNISNFVSNVDMDKSYILQVYPTILAKLSK
jgi:hypothetical protein